jgi:poly-gamma-glutamate synthesis protein (capsule biosynthesis protein)
MVQKQQASVILVAVGDISPNRDDPPSIFRYCGDIFRTADVVFGQMENPLTDKGIPMFTSHRPHRLPPRNISAYTKEGAGFDVMSHAANAAMDYGWEGFLDTLNILRKNNIAVVGAGKNIEEARRPVILERRGTRVGFLAYVSIIERGLIAENDIPGCAPLRSSHFYQQLDPQPGTPPLIITKLFPEDKKAMEEDIKKLRPEVDVVVVYMHCGVHFVPAVIAMYQKEAAYAAMDVGADLVLQSHAHILKGIEVYKGKVIFYGMGDFAAEHGRGFLGQLESFDHSTRGLKETLYHIKPEPADHPFHRERLHTMVVKAYIQDKKIKKVTYIPGHITANREPKLLMRKDPRAQEVFDYVTKISETEDLKVSFSWEGDEVLIS